jgi:hypothetical protein
LKTSGNCLVCQKSWIKDTPTSSICGACSKIIQDDVYFCDKCFESYHESKGLLLNNTDIKVSHNGREKSQGIISHGLDVYVKDEKDVRKN